MTKYTRNYKKKKNFSACFFTYQGKNFTASIVSFLPFQYSGDITPLDYNLFTYLQKSHFLWRLQKTSWSVTWKER